MMLNSSLTCMETKKKLFQRSRNVREKKYFPKTVGSELPMMCIAPQCWKMMEIPSKLEDLGFGSPRGCISKVRFPCRMLFVTGREKMSLLLFCGQRACECMRNGVMMSKLKSMLLRHCNLQNLFWETRTSKAGQHWQKSILRIGHASHLSVYITADLISKSWSKWIMSMKQRVYFIFQMSATRQSASGKRQYTHLTFCVSASCVKTTSLLTRTEQNK